MVAGVAFVGGHRRPMAGAVSQQVVIGIVGFVIMLVSATVALTAIRGQQAAASGEQGRTAHGLTVFDGGRATSRTRRRPAAATASATAAPSWSAWSSAGATAATSRAASDPPGSHRPSPPSRRSCPLNHAESARTSRSTTPSRRDAR